MNNREKRQGVEEGRSQVGDGNVCCRNIGWCGMQVMNRLNWGPWINLRVSLKPQSCLHIFVLVCTLFDLI